jgi:hypothetical protein
VFGHGQDGVADPRPYLYFTVVALDGINDLRFARTHSVANRDQTKAIREQAQKNDYELADRGRIPANVIAAYEEAQCRAP